MESKVKNAIINMNFIEEYQNLSDKFNNERVGLDDRLVYVDGEEVIEILENLGYQTTFNSKEKFYKIKEKTEVGITFGCHISLEFGMMEQIWVVKEGKKLLLGAPLGMYPVLLNKADEMIKKPVFGTYEDIEEILQISFELYKAFQKELIKLMTH